MLGPRGARSAVTCRLSRPTTRRRSTISPPALSPTPRSSEERCCGSEPCDEFRSMFSTRSRRPPVRSSARARMDGRAPRTTPPIRSGSGAERSSGARRSIETLSLPRSGRADDPRRPSTSAGRGFGSAGVGLSWVRSPSTASTWCAFWPLRAAGGSSSRASLYMKIRLPSRSDPSPRAGELTGRGVGARVMGHSLETNIS